MFYDNLEQVCKEKGLKVTPTVLKCGGSKGSLTAWKNGAVPNSDIVISLSVFLNVPTDRLLLGKEKSPSFELSEDRQRLLNMYNLLDDMEKGEILGELKVMTRYRADKDQQVRIAARSVGSNEPLDDNEILKKLDILDNIPEADEE